MAEPSKLGRYEIRQTLGRGAMGVVYEGFDPNLNRRVAIKTILQGATGDPEVARDFAMRFSREARAAARLSHPNIVQVYDFGVEEGLSYLVMEFVEGTELSAFFDGNEAFELEDVTRLMTQLLAALDLAHNAGIVHRDIKPANLMVDKDGQAKLADFGVARVSDGQDATQVGAMVGTPAYMSPEQVQGQVVDRRTDIFSAGVILYQFLTGQKPFQGGGAYTLARKIIHDEPATPSSLVPTVSPAYDRVIAKALAKNPDARYQTAKDFSQALERLLRQERPAEVPDDDSTRKISSADMPTRAEAPAPVQAEPSTTDVELEFWRSIKDSDHIDDIELYIAKFPAGVYSELAQRKVERLRRAAGAAAEESENLKRALEEEARARREAEEAARRAAEEKARLEAQVQKAAQLKREAEAEAAARREAEEARKAAAAPVQRAPAPPSPVAPRPAAAPEPAAHVQPAKKTSMAIPAGIAALVVAGAGAAYFVMQPKATPEVAAPIAPTAAPAKAAAPDPLPPKAEPKLDVAQPPAPQPAPVAEEKKKADKPKAEIARTAPPAAPVAKPGASKAEQEAAAKAAAEIAAAKAAADAAVAKASAAAAAAEQRAAAAEAAAKAAADKAEADKASTDKAAADKLAAERAAAEKAAAEQRSAAAGKDAAVAARRAARAKALEYLPSFQGGRPRSKAEIDEIIRQEEEAFARRGAAKSVQSGDAAAARAAEDRARCMAIVNSIEKARSGC